MKLSTLRPHRRTGAMLWVGCVWALLAIGTAQADVYKWADRDGRIHYTDRPPPAEGRLISVAQSAHAVTLNTTDVTADASPPKPSPLPAADAATLSRLKAGVAADVAARDAAACQGAEERYRQYVGARHLFKTGEHGERLYLTDAEMDSARVEARREVEELCGRSASSASPATK